MTLCQILSLCLVHIPWLDRISSFFCVWLLICTFIISKRPPGQTVNYLLLFFFFFLVNLLIIYLETLLSRVFYETVSMLLFFDEKLLWLLLFFPFWEIARWFYPARKDMNLTTNSTDWFFFLCPTSLTDYWIISIDI